MVEVDSVDDLPAAAVQERQAYEEEGVKSTLLLPLRGEGDQITGCVGLRSYSHPITWSQENVRRLRLFADAVANVQERQRAEKDLYKSRQMLQQILDNVPQRVFWKDVHSNYLGCNKPFAEDVALSDVHEIVGKNDFQLPAGEELAKKYRADDQEVIRSGVSKIGYEEQQKRLDGTVSWLRTSKVPLRDHNNEIFGVLGAYEDITKWREATRALEQAKEAAEAANRAKDRFIAVLSHELRTPLTPVLAVASAMVEMKDLTEQMRTNVELIQRNVDLEARLIDDLLDISRISQNKLAMRRESADIHDCIRSALEICQCKIAALPFKVETYLDAPLHYVMGDSTRLRQVFWNLLQNAVKFSPEQRWLRIRTLNDDGLIRIEIADNGIGIDPETMQRIFNAFEQGEQTWTRRFGGLGVGLSISKALVEAHKGTLTAFSEGVNKGSVFTIALPITSDAPPAKEANSTVETPRKILLVDDHPDTLQTLARLQQAWGYGVTTAESVDSGLKRARDESFDLCVSDLGLPDGNGCELMRQLKTLYQLPGIAVSGYGTDEAIRSSLEAGFSAHLIKPVSFPALRAAIQKLASKR
jgi:PAS domain S-box-containing protein